MRRTSRRRGGGGRLVVAVLVLLGSLSLVTWRQSRAIEAMEQLDRVRRDLSLTQADEAELHRRIQYLQSRGRVVPEARERLGMRLPDTGEQVLLDRGSP